MKFMGKIALIGAVCALAVPAGAQSANTLNTLSAQPAMMVQVSAADVASMMSELGVSTELKMVDAGNPPFLVANTPGGGRFVFQFFSCDDVAGASGCANTVVSTAFPSAGVTFDDLNEFNGQSRVTTAVSVGDAAIVILGRNIVVYGGHSRDLFKGTVYLFLRDVQEYAQRTAVTSVSFSPTPERASKINGERKALSTTLVSAPFGKMDISVDLETAIRYSRDTDFSVNFEPVFQR